MSAAAGVRRVWASLTRTTGGDDPLVLRRHEEAQDREYGWLRRLSRATTAGDRAQALLARAAAEDELAATYCLLPWDVDVSPREQADMAAGFVHSARICRMVAAAEQALADGTSCEVEDEFVAIPGVRRVLAAIAAARVDLRGGWIVRLSELLEGHLAGQAHEDLWMLARAYDTPAACHRRWPWSGGGFR